MTSQTFLKTFTPQELEYFAEQEIIQIIPNFREDSFNFVSGTFGPFRPAKPVSVPLWLAVYLKIRNKCQVQLPKWVDYDFLVRIKQQEKEVPEEFSEELPYYYFEIAQLLFNNCADEFAHLAKLKSIIEDIYELRKEKMLKLLKAIDPATPVKYLSYAGATEVNNTRQAFQAAYNVVNHM